MIKIRDLTKVYDQKVALTNISAEIESGSVFGVMGRNGAGKTTLIRCLLGELPFEGNIAYPESFLATSGRLDFRVTHFVGDQPHLYDYLTALEYIQFVLALKEQPVPEPERILDSLEVFGISPRESCQLIKTYSFGMRRKVALVSGFLMKPRLMVLDEPTTGLDVPSVITLKSLIKEQAQQGTTFVISSHEPAVMEELSDALLILNQTQTVYWNPKFSDEVRDLPELYMECIGEDSVANAQRVVKG